MSEPFNFHKLDRPGRPTNRQLIEAFRDLLTHGAKEQIEAEFDRTNAGNAGGLDKARLMVLTKPWRGELWKAFAEIEERLDPLGAEERRRANVGKTDGKETRSEERQAGNEDEAKG